MRKFSSTIPTAAASVVASPSVVARRSYGANPTSGGAESSLTTSASPLSSSSQSQPQQQAVASSSPMNGGADDASSSVALQQRVNAFMTTFAKTFVTETIAHTAMTRRAVRRWTKSVTSAKGATTSSRRANQLQHQHASPEAVAQMALVRSLAIRTPGSNTPAPKKDGAPAKKDGSEKPSSVSPNPKDSKTAASSTDPTKKKKGKGDDDEGGDEGGAGDEDIEADAITPMVTKFVLAVFVLSGVLYYLSKPTGKLSSWEAVAQRTDPLMRVDIYHDFAEFHFSEGPTIHVGLLEDDGHTEMKLKETLAKCSLGEGFSTNWIGESFSESMLHFVGVFAWIVPFVFFPSFVMILTRAIGTAMTGVQEGKNKVTSKVMFHVQKGSKTRFSDIAGMTEAKQEVTEIVDFLKHPERYTRLGAKVPTGALLLGPPGTGKTLLAKAVAGEAGVAFIPCTGSDFVELYVGMGALRVRQLFELAKKQRCIIYIDEIDAIGLKRSGAGHGEKQEQEHTLNELLTQLDGFGSNRGEVMILASSNVAQSELDPALIRPGRFDRLVNVDAPVIKERIDIFKVHLSNLKLVPTAPTTAAGAAVATATAVPPSDAPAATPATSDAAAKISASLDSANDAKEAEKATPIPTTAATPSSSSSSSSTGGALAVVPGTSFEETLMTEEDDADSKDIARRKMVAAAKSALEEKLSKLSEQERVLVDNYAVRMSDLCPGFVGADIMNVCNEGAILAARESCDCVTINHLERSIDRVIAGIEHRSRVLSPFEKNVVAHHEAGHAVAGWFLGRADPLMKVSIVPRGGSALGYAQYLPNENHLRTSNEIKDSICVTLGGRVAERIFFNHLSTGASDDLRKVTRMAYMHVSSFNTTTAHHAPGTRNTRYQKPYGAAISDKIDVAAKALVDEMFERTMVLLTEKKHEMELLANHLLKHEVLTHADVVGYLGARPPRPTDRRKYYVTAADAAKTDAATAAAAAEVAAKKE